MKKVVISGMIANATEWYEFVLYIQFATIISKLFFPATDEFTALLFSFATFAVGFVMRPLGGILFGFFGDKYGRKMSLVVSILMMAIPTALIGLIPTYAQIGVWAPVLLILMRLFQGLSLGGGFSGCMIFLVEHSPIEKRGLIGSSSMFSLGAGVLLGIIVAGSCIYLIPSNEFESWGWRIPFIASILISLVGFYIKNNISESPVYKDAQKHKKLSKTPIRDVVYNHGSALIQAIAIYLTVTVPFYSFTAFFPLFLGQNIGMSHNDVTIVNLVSIIAFISAIPLSGIISDRVGRKKVLLLSAAAIFICAYPTFLLLIKPGLFAPLFGAALFATFVGFYVAPVPAALVELFPTGVRYSGLALSYNIAAAAFGGTVPLVCLTLVKNTGSLVTPAFYIMIFAFLTITFVSGYKDRYKEALAE